ncbi:MAG: hypothetical protein GY925_07975, partial [Actinomycetia bacterium]|nr:hypothetical protein [Actinomycetes bacterium]
MKSDAPTIVVSGWIKRLNSRRVHPEWHSADYIVRKGARGPRWIATGDGAPRWHLAENWVSSRPWILRIRKALFTSRLAMAATSVRVLTRADTTVPYPLAIAARQMTFPVPAAWMVLFGDGSDRAKIVAFAFDDKARHPRWVVKFARTTWPEPEEDPHPWPLIRESETE